MSSLQPLLQLSGRIDLLQNFPADHEVILQYTFHS